MTQKISMKKLLTVCLKHWLWFCISIVICVCIGLVVYMTTSYKYTTLLNYRVRENEQTQMFQNLAMSADQSRFGLWYNVHFIDEQEQVNSHVVMRNVITELGLQHEYQRKHKHDWRWAELKNTSLVQVEYSEVKQKITTTVTQKMDGYKVVVKKKHKTSRFFLQAGEHELSTCAGDMRIKILEDTAKTSPLHTMGDKIRIVTRSVEAQADRLTEMVQSERVNPDTRVLCISATTAFPYEMENIMNNMVVQYNRLRTEDLCRMADSIDVFLQAQIQQTEQQLNQMPKTNAAECIAYENKVESYKSLLQYRENNRLRALYSIEPIYVIDPAYTFVQKAAPRLSLILILSVLMGGLLPLLLLFVTKMD